jgi:hypothetical protein
MTLSQASPTQSLLTSLLANPADGNGHDEATLAICQKAAEQGIPTRLGATLLYSPSRAEGPGVRVYVVPDRK